MATEPLEYVRHGLALVPIGPGEKRPARPRWNHRDQTISDPISAQGLQGSIGIAHAYCTPAPTAALDIDDFDDAKLWLAERQIDLAALLDDDDAVQITSGRPGRAKLLYQLPRGSEPLRTLQIKDPTSGKMVLELRCATAEGLTVQDILPPSIHPVTGQPYRWAGKGSWRNLPCIPPNLLVLWKQLLGATKAGPVTTNRSAPATAVDAETQRDLRSALFSMRADDRELWIKMGLALKSMSEIGRGLWLEWSLTSEKSMEGDPLALSRTWEGLKPEKIDYRSVFVEAQKRGWANPTNQVHSVVPAALSNGAWQLPEALPPELLPVKKLDLEWLPTTIRAAVGDISERLSCPVDYVATPLLVCAGAIVGNRIGILPKEHDATWEVYPALWGGIVGPPGSMKTPAQQEAMKPLRHIEQQEAAAHAKALGQYKLDKRRYEEDLAAHKAGKLQALPVEPVEPKAPRLVVNDVTYQALGAILAANTHGLLIYGDELSGLLKSLDAPGQEAARAFYLSGWGGNGSYTFDRIGRGSIRLERYALSIFGGFQPDKIKEYVRGAQSGSTQNDGLLQRFQLLVWPTLERDFVFVDRGPDQAAINAMNAALLNLRKRMSNAQANGYGAKLVHFDPDAQQHFNKWYEANERLLRKDTLSASEQSHFAKYRSLVPALALLFHLLEGHEGAVCSDCLERALSYALYLKTHAQRAYGAVNRSDGACIRALAEKLREGALQSGFTHRNLYAKGWRSLTDKGATKDALDQLTELGWLREQPTNNAGRPTVNYEINPRIMEVPG